LGLSIGGTSPAPGWAPPVAIAAFTIGAAGGSVATTDGKLVVTASDDEAIEMTKLGENIGEPATSKPEHSTEPVGDQEQAGLATLAGLLAVGYRSSLSIRGT
jgi:hypothetical protein